MFVIEYRIGSFVRHERAIDDESAFARARELWSTDGCAYVFVRPPNGAEKISVKRPPKTPWPGRPDRRLRPR